MTQIDLFNGNTPALPDKGALSEVFKRISDFQVKANKKADTKFVEKTPDGRADTLVISYVENRLDELYSGLWSTSNFRYQVVANEIAGSITLKVLNPSCGVWIEREGAAAVQIMVDRCPENIQGEERNQWALNLQNKKANSLQTVFPKLKAECMKNAAKSLGASFGRDLNRKKSDSEYNPDIYDEDSIPTRESIKSLCKTTALPKGEVDIMIQFANDHSVSITRLMNIEQRLKDNQK